MEHHLLIQQQERRLMQTLELFETQHAALEQTLATLLAIDDLPTAAQLAQRLGCFWESHEHLIEGGQWVAQILAHPAADTLPIELRAELNLIAGELARHRTEYRPALDYYTTTLAHAEDINLHTAALTGQAEVVFRQGDFAAATAYYDTHLNLSQRTRHQPRIADALNGLGRLAMSQRHFAQADEFFQQGAALAEPIGYRRGMAWSRNAMGELARAQGRPDQAIPYFAEGAAIFQVLRQRGYRQLVMQNLGFALLATGDAGKFAAAEGHFKDVLQFWRRGEAKHGMALCLIGLAGVMTAQKNATHAVQVLGYADGMMESIGVRLEISDGSDFERIAGMAQQQLGYAVYHELWQAGRGLSFDQILQRVGLLELENEIPPMTPREIEILRQVAGGATDKQIAQALVISPHTVNVHLRAIYRKLGTHTRTAAVALAQERGFI